MSAPPILKKLCLSLGALAIFLGIPAVWLWYTFAGPGYYAEFNDIKASFETMPDVDIVEIGGNRDLTYEDIWAHISVRGKGHIHLYSLTRKSFRDGDHVILGAIGPYDINVEGEGYVGAYKMDTGEPVRSQFYGGAIDVGREGAFANFFPFEISNVQDVIARYDDITAIISQWPAEADKKHFKDEEGTDYYYFVKEIKPEDRRVFPGPASVGTASEKPSS